jgi:3-carboxy-cis,cis-muconate cycloisomerase
MPTAMTSSDSRSLLDPLFTTERMRAVASDRSRVQGMLDFEAALARAAASAGIVPSAAAERIAACCRAELFDLESLGDEAAAAGNPAIPLVRALTEQVERSDRDAARWVHFGATSQDAMDTGLVLQLRAALDVLDGDLGRLVEALLRLTRAHRSTPAVARTWLQQAEPTTLGLRTAGWLAAADRHRARLREVRARSLVVQLGGAVGNLAALGERGPRVVELLAAELGLGVPELPWHTHRDRLVEAASAMGLLTGTLGKIARDVALLMQTEVGEAAEPAAPGRGGSSSMPQKRNPVAAALVGAAALRVPALVSTLLAAMVQEQERGLGGWHAEWEVLPEIWLLAGGALSQVVAVAEGLEVDARRMADNLAASGGALQAGALASALSGRMGRAEAHALVERASRRAREAGRSLREALLAESELPEVLSEAELDRLLDPRAAAEAAARLVDALLARRGS